MDGRWFAGRLVDELRGVFLLSLPAELELDAPLPVLEPLEVAFELRLGALFVRFSSILFSLSNSCRRASMRSASGR